MNYEEVLRKRCLIYVVLIWAFVLTAAYAVAQGHTIDFTQVIIGLDGKPMTSIGPDAKPLTLGDVAIQALTVQFTDEQTMPGDKKFALYELARKVYKGKAVTLTAEDVATLKERIGKAWGPAVVGAAWPMLDPAVGGK